MLSSSCYETPSAHLTVIRLLTVHSVQVTPIAIAAISWRYFFIFVFPNAIFIIVVYFKFPETSGVPLKEVAALFGDKVAYLDQKKK